MSGGGGGGKKTETTTSTPYQQSQYNTLLGQSTDWLNKGGFDQSYGGSPDFNANAPITADQLAGIQGISQGGQNLSGLLGNQGMDALGRQLGQYDPEASGLSAAIEAANRQSSRDFNQAVMPAIGSGAQGAGQYGSTRHGVAQGIAAQGLADTQAANANTLAFQDYQNFRSNQSQTLGNLGAISQGLLSGDAAQYDAGSLQQGQQQQQINADLQKWAYENNIDLNTLLAYQQLISGDMGGTNMSVSKGGGGKGGSLLGTIGTVAGTVIGGIYGGPAGAAAGASVGGAVGGAVG